MIVQNVVPIHTVDVQIIHCKNENYDLLVLWEKVIF